MITYLDDFPDPHIESGDVDGLFFLGRIAAASFLGFRLLFLFGLLLRRFDGGGRLRSRGRRNNC